MYDGSFDDIMLVPERLDDSLPNRSRVSLILSSLYVRMSIIATKE